MLALALAAVLRRVAGARLDSDRERHLLDRAEQVAGDVVGERLQGRDVERMQPARGALLGQLDQARQEPAQRLAAARGCDQERVATLARHLEHGGLVPAQLPAAVGEPAGEGCGQRYGRREGCLWEQSRGAAVIVLRPSHRPSKEGGEGQSAAAGCCWPRSFLVAFTVAGRRA
jgi:hypothetical protein